jgi:hypothetical protein
LGTFWNSNQLLLCSLDNTRGNQSSIYDVRKSLGGGFNKTRQKMSESQKCQKWGFSDTNAGKHGEFKFSNLELDLL